MPLIHAYSTMYVSDTCGDRTCMCMMIVCGCTCMYMCVLVSLQAKSYQWLPGSGISIEIFIKDSEKPFLFGAMLSRDDTFDSIVAHGLSLDLDWASRAWESRNSLKRSHDSVADSESSAWSEGSRDDLSASSGDTEGHTELRQRPMRMSELCAEDEETIQAMSMEATAKL